MNLQQMIAADLAEYKLPEDLVEPIQSMISTLLEVNKTINLTATREEVLLYERHLHELFLMIPMIRGHRVKSFLDLGCGGGFAGLLMKILLPDLKVTFLDSVRKKLTAIELIGEKTGCTDLHFLGERAEDLAHQAAYRDHFDFVATRAVAPINIICEVALPLVRLDGLFMNYSRKMSAKDLNSYKKACAQLKGPVQDVCYYEQNDKECQITMCRKKEPTPMLYPRQFSMIKKTPLFQL